MSPTREQLSAYIDGELEPTEMATIATQIESSAELQRYVLNQERLLENLHAAFAPLMNEPLPERLLRAATATPISFRVQLREWLSRRGSLRSGSVLRFAMPATALALGVFVGIGIERPVSGPDFVASPTTGQVFAQANLARALNTQLASEQLSAGPRIGVTFRNKEGDVCRTFEVAGASSTTDGLACHHSGEWQIGSLVSGGTNSAAGTTYQLAASETPAVIRDAVSSQISGVPFDAAAERRARDHGWK